ncbi:ferrochelatase [Nonomuraea sp. NBC_01738]|uniref:ferrochelatase n=1 Tax=Nonomuraea sp. NBC_01738 TaxID=2976003 RepID=UPI002E1081A7|nr:ferrochelatase [Nonomuraea sp. NBC_01738]
MGNYDALLILSFGGPEGPDDVMPFLENVVRGRGVPRARLEEVARHYLEAGGVSPINRQNRDLIAALRPTLDIPVYWGNRNWAPYGEDVVRQMRDDGVRTAAVFATSAFAGYSSCRQYYEDIARISLPGGPELVKLGHYGDRPGFVTAMAERVRDAYDRLGRADARLVFTAHSIPLRHATGAYESELRHSAELVNRALGREPGDWDLVWQSRSGPPQVPWLEPDICDHLRKLDGPPAVVIAPLGFVSDHMEVVYDLDTEARQVAGELGLAMERAATVGVHPAFVAMVGELLAEPEPEPCSTETCPQV